MKDHVKKMKTQARVRENIKSRLASRKINCQNSIVKTPNNPVKKDKKIQTKNTKRCFTKEDIQVANKHMKICSKSFRKISLYTSKNG